MSWEVPVEEKEELLPAFTSVNWVHGGGQGEAFKWRLEAGGKMEGPRLYLLTLSQFEERGVLLKKPKYPHSPRGKTKK